MEFLRNLDEVENHSTILTILCIISTICLNLSPAVLFFEYYKQRRVLEKFPEWMFITAIFFASTNLSYGLLSNEKLIVFSFGFCLVVQIFYATVFLFLYANKNFSKWFLYVIITYDLTLEILYIFSNVLKFHNGKIFAQNATKYVNAVVLILNAAAPGQKILDVFKNEDFPLIPIVTSICQIICCILWTIYGFGSMNAVIFVPNLIGILISGLQIMTYFVYFSKRQGIAPTTSERSDSDIRDEEQKNINEDENACKLLGQ